MYNLLLLPFMLIYDIIIKGPDRDIKYDKIQLYKKEALRLYLNLTA